ncbi:MAG: BatD family protein [Saprospiraceae bacterium]
MYNIKSFKLKWSLLWMVIFLGWTAVVGQSPRFYLNASSNNIAEGETFTLQAVLENIDARAIQMPDLAPFKVLQGPATSTSISIVNGARSSSISYQYTLLAPAKGVFSIGPATVKVGGKTIKSDVISIQVSTGKPAPKYGEIDESIQTFIRIEASTVKAYIGQQIIVNYVLYTRQNIESYNFLSSLNFEGFYSQPINDIRDAAQRKTINGKEYYSQVLKRDLLFPQKVGKYTLGPVHVSLDIPTDDGPSSFFFRNTRKEQTTTNSLVIHVMQLPTQSGPSFSGGVGRFDMKANIVNTRIRKGESIIVQMQIDGDGDAKILKAPDFIVSADLEKYEPTTLKDEVAVQGDKLKTLRVYEYVFVPKKDSIYSIVPEFTYFSPETERFETITAGPFTVVVSGEYSTDTSTTPSGQSSELDGMTSEDLTLYDTKSGFLGSFRYFVIIFSIFMIGMIGIFYKRSKIKSSIQNENNLNKAVNRALHHLEKAKSYLDQGDQGYFYDEISKAIKGFIIQKFSIEIIDSDTHQVAQLLSDKKVTESLIDLYQEIDKKCMLARFAGNYDDMAKIYDDSYRLIISLDDMS